MTGTRSIRHECSAERRAKVKAARLATAIRRRHQIGFVFECKIVEKRLNKTQKEQLQRLFVEGKWFYNHVLSMHKDGKELTKIDANGIKEVTRINKDKERIWETLTVLTGQQKQGVVSRMAANEKTIASLTKRGKQNGGELHYLVRQCQSCPPCRRILSQSDLLHQ